MCGKIRYKSRSQAEGVRRSLKRYSLNAYRCPECSGKVWHLGHPIGYRQFSRWLKGEIT